MFTRSPATMPKPNRIIYPPAYWEKKIWEMKWEKLPDLKYFPREEGTEDYEDAYDYYEFLNNRRPFGF